MRILGIQGRLYPSEHQLDIIKQTCGCCRFVYNHMLDYSNKEYKNGNKTNYNQWSAYLTQLKKEQDKKWLQEVSSTALQQSIRDLDSAYKRFFKQVAKFPKFKSKHNKNAYRLSNISNTIRLLPHKIIKLPTLGKVKYRGLKNIPKQYRITSATITKTTDNQVFISLRIETEEELQPYPVTPNSNVVGIDMGVKRLATCSDGTIFPRLNLKQLNAKKDFYDSKVSTSQKSSMNRWRWMVKRSKVLRRISNMRKGYAQHIAHILTLRNQTICIEDLSVVDMVSKGIGLSKFNRAIIDSGMGQLGGWLSYMCLKRGRDLIVIDRYYPSSQLCHVCGYRHHDVKDLSVRSWDCPICGSHHDRDLNASYNIRDAGLATRSLSKDKMVNTC